MNRAISQYRISIITLLYMMGVLTIWAPLYGQSGPDENLPLDPRVIKGTLDNGFTYYIRHNSDPENRLTPVYKKEVCSPRIVLSRDTPNLHIAKQTCSNNEP